MKLGALAVDLSGRAMTRAIEQARNEHDKDNIGMPLWKEAEEKNISWLQLAKQKQIASGMLSSEYLMNSVRSQRDRSGLNPINIADLRNWILIKFIFHNYFLKKN